MATRSLPTLSTPRGLAVSPALGRAWVTLCALMRVRTTRRLLLEMEPRMLADIGASRGDAQTEAARPFWDIAPRCRS